MPAACLPLILAGVIGRSEAPLVFDGARGETVIEVSGEGPWGVKFLDPGKDPAAPPGPR